VHLAASGNAPDQIFPVVIDQDEHNGNLNQCRKTVELYQQVYQNAHGINNQKIFNSCIEKTVFLKPNESNINFESAIEIHSMSSLEQQIIKALYNDLQLCDVLKDGYKKRAYIGSILIKKMLTNADKDPTSELNNLIDVCKNLYDLEVIVVGSIFGGTGAAGIVVTGQHLREKLPHAKMSSIMMTPYFKIANEYEKEDDQGIVTSDSDMNLVKIALEMNKADIETAFDHVCIIGSELDYLQSENATKKAYVGGEKQRNPAHVFELIAACFSKKEKKLSDSTKYYSYGISSNDKKPKCSIRITQLPKEIEMQKVNKLLDFASLIVKANNNPQSWKIRQPWFPPENEFTVLFNWAERHLEWWNEMDKRGVNDHNWNMFNIDLEEQHIYKIGAQISMFIGKNYPKNAELVYDVINSLNTLVVKESK